MDRVGELLVGSPAGGVNACKMIGPGSFVSTMGLTPIYWGPVRCIGLGYGSGIICEYFISSLSLHLSEDLVLEIRSQVP